MKQLVDKQVRMELVGKDGNAFAILGRFQSAARRQKWTPEEIKLVMDEAMAGDYDHLLVVMVAHVIEPDEEGGDDYETD